MTLEVIEGGKAADEAAKPEHQNGEVAALRVELAARVTESVSPPPAATKPMLDIGPCASGAEAVTKLRALKRKKVAIVGFAPSSYRDAPFQDPEWEVWSLNEAYTLEGFSRADRWFEIHIRDEIDVTSRDKNHIEWLRAQKALPIYMTRRFEDIPMSVEFPIKPFIKRFRTLYWTNTISYMIALAVAEGFTTIGIWGVDMAQSSFMGGPSEYGEQRPSCEYFIGWAQAKGVNVYIPPQSDLMKSIGLYGYDVDGSRFKGKLRGRIQELQSRINGQRQIIGVLERNRWGATGAMQEIQKLFPPDQVDDATRERIANHLAGLAQNIANWENQLQQASVVMQQLTGAADDCMYWLRNWAPQVAIESDVTPAVPAASEAPA